MCDVHTRQAAYHPGSSARRGSTRGNTNTRLARVHETISYRDLKRETIISFLRVSYLAKPLEKRGAKCREVAEWMRSVIQHELGSPAPFMNCVGSGLARVLLCAGSVNCLC